MPESPMEKKGVDRRAAVRYPCTPGSFSSDNSCRPITAPQKEAWTAIVRDISVGGLGIVVPRRFEPGTLLTVDLEDAERTTRRSLLVRVMHIKQETPNSWVLGCSFPTQMTEAELLALM